MRLRNLLRRWLGITALEASLRRPEARGNASAIAQWHEGMRANPPGSPKWIAFRNRLRSRGIEVGD